MPTASQIQKSVNDLYVDSGKLHQIVHGDANTVVPTESGPVKSVANLQREFNLDAAETITEVEGVRDQAIAARDAVKPLSGTGAPAAGLGIIGTVYYDISDPLNVVMYGPKTSGGWGPGRDLRGATGGSNNTFFTKSALKDAPVVAGSYTFAPASGSDGGLAAGRFLYQTAGAPYTPDDANVIALNAVLPAVGALVRQPEELIKPSATALTNAIATALAAGGGAVRLDKGSFTGGATVPNREIALEGRGTTTSISPSTPTGVALRITGQEASWTTPIYAAMNFQGTGSRQGTGIRFGPDAYSSGAEYIGRVERNSHRYENFDVCVDRPFGAIGDYAFSTRYELANIHTKAVANPGSANGGQGDTMHPGCSFYMNEHRQGAMIASDYIDGQGVIGTCQIIRINPIDEGNPGHNYYWRGMANRGGFPSPLIMNAYNEANNTATGVTTPDGVTAVPAWLYATDCDLIQIVNSTPGRMTLVKSAVMTIGADMTNAVGISGIDNDSSLIHNDVRCFAGKVPGLTRSIAQLQNLTGLNGPSFEMASPQGLATFTAGRSNGVYNAQLPEIWGGSGNNITTTTVANDAGLPGLLYSQDVALPANSTYLPSAFTIPTGYSVAFVRVRVVSGPGTSMRIDGNAGIGGTVPVDNAEWRTLVWAFYNPGGPIANEAFYFRTGNAPTTLRIGGRGILTFNTLQEATAAINSGLFPAEQRMSYAITNTNFLRTVNADAQVPAAGTTYSQTAVQAMVDEINALKRVVATLIQDLRTKGVQ